MTTEAPYSTIALFFFGTVQNFKSQTYIAEKNIQKRTKYWVSKSILMSFIRQPVMGFCYHLCSAFCKITPLEGARHGSRAFQMATVLNLTVAEAAKVDHQMKQSHPVSSLVEPMLSIPTHNETDLTEFEPAANTLSSMNDSALMGCWDRVICQGCVINPAAVLFITSESL